MDKKDQRTIIVTGGNKGIGAMISRVFYRNGDYVIIGARTNNGIAERLGDRAYFRVCDVRKKSDHEVLVKAAMDNTGRLDVYINCAGFSEWHSLNEIEEDFLNNMIDTNLKGVFWGAKAAAASMHAGCSIINISSLAGKRGSANNSVYCASKFGVNGLTQALAKELGPIGIRVNAVCPVYVKTEGLIEALGSKDSPAGGKDVSEYLEDFEQTNTALKRLPTAEEIAQVCVFLASSEASAITGQCINVDCGVMPQ